MLNYDVLAPLHDPILDRDQIYRATHQVAALHGAIEGCADIQFATLRPRSPAALSCFKSSRSPSVRTKTLPPISSPRVSEAGSGGLNITLLHSNEAMILAADKTWRTMRQPKHCAG